MRSILIGTTGLVAAALLAFATVAATIVWTAAQSDLDPADVAVVLGAAVADDEPTPVFRERLRHAVDLYQSGQARRLVMTGGTGPGDALAEAEAGREYALANGVPDEAIGMETASVTTHTNLTEALPMLEGRVLVVTDPLHMARALMIARNLGIDAHPSPTPTSRFLTLETQVPMLMREVWFTFGHMIGVP